MKAVTLIVRMTREDRHALDEAANAAGAKNTSDWARDVLLAAAGETLAGRPLDDA